MDVDSSEVEVHNNEAKKRFEVNIGKHTAVIEYMKAGKNIIFSHTEVPVELEGQGIGSRMARAALDYARDNNLTVMPMCPFVAAYIRKHPEYHPITMGYKQYKEQQDQNQ